TKAVNADYTPKIIRKPHVLIVKDVFGEMVVFEREVTSATVHALREVRVLSVDTRNFLRRVHEDPSFAYRILQKMSQRIRQLSTDLVGLKIERQR
ncbi:MAG: cyclic nucleotide-binding domain-containing protein, partial [Candidatus Tectomicrobia bacterium]|nr:cyclic nucleotide-binding domain-containing protein [Candidatus Tectomicrobia bacterium]